MRFVGSWEQSLKRDRRWIRMRLSALGRAFVVCAVVGESLLAEELVVPLAVRQTAERTVDSPVDARNFTDPRAYRQHGTASRVFQRRLTLTNTGATPLKEAQLTINGADWSNLEGLRAGTAASSPAREWLPRLFRFWCDHISHADSDAPGGKEPFALLNFWGYALCGDTTAAFAHLAAAQGVPARKIPLNGHVAAEYFYDGTWHIFDTDQNVVYLQLDNHTPASAADLRRDPLLAKRTKVFGRYRPMDLAASSFNTALHEFVQPKEEKPVARKKGPAPVRAEMLYPGERMIIYGDQAPGRAVGRTDLTRWGSVREDALSLVEFVLIPRARQTPIPGEVAFASGFPILSAVNHTTGDVVTTPDGQPAFEIKIKCTSPDDRISVYAQRARAAMPMIQKGRNTFRLNAADANGSATLVVDWDRAPAGLVIPAATVALAEPAPTFTVTTSAEADLLWWQAAETASFDFVSPNFDSVTKRVEQIRFDPLTATFLNPHQPYFFRVKARHAGVWGEWSAPLEFRVEKPPRPAPIDARVVGNRWRLRWPDAGPGCEYLVFGSNRLDFLPELFTAEEIVGMRDQGVDQSRPNKNLAAMRNTSQIEFEPTFRFYRVITRRAGVLSVPGDLLVTPPPLAAQLPPALVLQNRWHRAGDTDEHHATEMPLP